MLIRLIQPYTRIKIGFISGELNIEPSDVESLLVSCILDTTIYGRIDQVIHIFGWTLELVGKDHNQRSNLILLINFIYFIRLMVY